MGAFGPVLRPDTLAEMLRQAERVVDDQVKTFERADAKSERLVGLCMAVLGAGLAIAAQGLAAKTHPPDVVVVIALGLGAALGVRALWCFLGASLGMFHHSEVQVGPSPASVIRQETRVDRSLTEFQAATMETFAQCYLDNLAKLEEALQLRQRGLRFLLMSSTLFASGMLYIAGW